MEPSRMLFWTQTSMGMALILSLPVVGGRRGQGSVGFRNLERGKVVPTVEASELIGTKTKLYFTGGDITVLAFLRQDQEDSKRVFEMLKKLASDERQSRFKIVVLATGKHTNRWLAKARSLPKGMDVYLDDRGASSSIGVRVTPCLALMDQKGRLCETYLLHDDTLDSRIRKAIFDIRRRKGAPPPAADPKQLRYQELEDLAAALTSQGDYREAMELRKKQLDLGIHEAKVRVEIARILLALGHGNWALDHLRASLALEDRLPTRVLLGRALLLSGSLKEARKQLEGLVDLNPNKSEVLWLLSQVAKRQGDVDAALDFVKRAIKAIEH